MTPFTKSNDCLAQAHCIACRTQADWRAVVGAPNVCPYGVTLELAQERRLESEDGTGTYLHMIFKKFGIGLEPSCKCFQHIVAMNRYGPQWCEENMETVIGWLKEEADRRGLPFIQVAAMAAIKSAISMEKKRLAQASKGDAALPPTPSSQE